MNMLARLKRRSPLTLLASLAPLLGLVAALLPSPAHAGGTHPATQALDDLQGKKAQLSVIQNKFFVKSNRFEIAPMVGYVPNNSFVSSPVGGAFLAYHFSETFAAEGSILYGPNTGDGGIKNLTQTLVGIAFEGDPDTTFKQPLDRIQLGAIFDARLAPVYGKINLLGEGVLNFDFYATAGLGLLLITKDYAIVNPEYVNGNDLEHPATSATNPTTAANVAVNLGVGFDFFLTQGIALKIDARSLLYVAKEPDYGNTEADGSPKALNSRLYNSFITTAGVSIFVPKMKPRLSNF